MEEAEGILYSVKRLLVSYLDSDDEEFDTDLIMHINTVFSVLYQLGVGKKGFHITGPDETWDDFLEGKVDLELIKSFVVLRVRMLFDPPTSSALSNTIDQQIKELTWRINVEVDPENCFD